MTEDSRQRDQRGAAAGMVSVCPGRNASLVSRFAALSASTLTPYFRAIP
jgi:hypothetical protein